MAAHAYPVHVDARLDSHLSRWLWLVKWLLAIPHYILLAFLWMAFFVLSVVAFVAILFTGHYPRSIFEFNVGVMRWSWRVAYYTYGALGTDRYPPFTLNEVPDYPAHLTVDYPEHLSRGLVLVKWWLLAIPHYLVVGLLLGSGAWVAYDVTQGDGGAQWTWGGGLIGLLVTIAAVVLLFTGRYPEQLFDLVLGLNRWVLRVAAYAGLMTDEYPPFRLDQGGPDPDGGGHMAVPAAPAPAQAPTQAPAQAPTVEGQAPPAEGQGVSWTTGRIVAVVVGSVVFLMAAGFLLGGTSVAVADRAFRNDQGYLMSPTQSLSTATYAVASKPLAIDSGSSVDVVPQAVLGDVALRAQAADGGDIFIGVAPAADVEAYLANVQHATLVGIEDVNGQSTPFYRESPGAAPSVLPGDANIWTASASGPGRQELSWAPRNGDWAVVVMNADGSANVAANVSVGATAPVLGWVAVGLLIAGGVLLLIAIAIVLAAVQSARSKPAAPAEGPGA
jgi:hypothetical protein